MNRTVEQTFSTVQKVYFEAPGCESVVIAYEQLRVRKGYVHGRLHGEWWYLGPVIALERFDPSGGFDPDPTLAWRIHVSPEELEERARMLEQWVK